MLNIFNKVKSLKKIEKVYKMSLFFPSTVSFAMNNSNHKGQVANGNININNAANNSEINTVYNNVINKINKNLPDDKKFIFKGFLGKGGFGEVILVGLGNKELAIKVTKYTKQDVNELMILKKFKKKGIIEYYAATELKENNNPGEKRLALILEYCKYGNIYDFMKKILKRKVMSESLVCYMAGQVVSALKFIHSIDIAHFDLKPNNILVNEFLDFKLSDFSTAYKYDKKLKNYKYSGSGPYMAPEVLKVSKIENYENFFKSDVFSLGVMCYKLFTGAYPFFNNNNKCLDSNDKIDYLKCIKKNAINLKELEDCEPSDVFKDFLLKCLEKDVNKRPDIFQLENHPFIKHYKILSFEKEKLYDAGLFLGYLITDYFKSYGNECEKYELKDGILTLKNNIDLGQFMDDKFGSKKNKVKAVLKKYRKVKTLKKNQKK